MKQNITPKQLKELNQEELENLNSLMPNPYLQRICYSIVHKNRDQDYIKAAYDINIGTMIETLIDSVPKTDSIEDSVDIECDRVTNSCLIEYRKSNMEFADFEDDELCDALWKAVRNIL